MAPPKKKKDPFAALPQSWKDGIEGSTTDQLKACMAQTAKDEAKNQSAKKADQDLLDKKRAYQSAGVGYSDKTKENRLKIKYLIRNLSDKGDAESQQIIQMDINAEAMK